ncbi:MAG: hypothetical protein JW994_00920 [Candidatus Omnitrophica bacterium]|nr:hypothetical protein [Candidatus Omnitrophota bacterium]
MISKKSLPLVILTPIAVFCVFVFLSTFFQLRKVEAKLGMEKARFIKEKMDLEDEIASVQQSFFQKSEELSKLSVEYDKLKGEMRVKITQLEKDNSDLADKLKKSESISLVDRIREALKQETNESIKRYLENVLYNLVLVKSGESVELEPIVVKKKSGELGTGDKMTSGNEPAYSKPVTDKLITEGKIGKVVSIDRSDNLIVIDLGLKDNIEEGERCLIIQDNKEIGSGKVIGLRYGVAAIFVDELKYKETMRTVKEGDSAIFEK